MSTLATSASTLNDHTFPQLLILAEIAHYASAMAAVVFKEPEGRQVVSRLKDALLVTLDSELAAVADAARGQAGLAPKSVERSVPWPENRRAPRGPRPSMRSTTRTRA